MATPKRLYFNYLPATGSTTLFTVPANHIYTVKQIIICNINDPITGTGSPLINNDSAANCVFTYNNGTTDLILFQNIRVRHYDTVILDVERAFAAASTLKISSDQSLLRVCVSGYDNG
jgi:hypothetical protein